MRRPGPAAIAALAAGWVLLMQSLGWAQTSYYAMVKALDHGTASIDAYHWETRDKSYIGGHFYSVKAPGLPLLLAPAYAALDAVGAPALAREAADRARHSGARQWTYRGLNVHAYGYDRARAAQIKRRLEVQAPMVWLLGLLGTVLPAVLLLLLVRRLAERVEPGTGTLAALTLGMGTLVMPFAVQLFGHVLASLLLFGAFAVAWSERDRAAPDRRRLLLAGVLAGLAVTTEYPLAFGGAVVGCYAALGHGAGLRRAGARAAAFAAGLGAGVLPLLAYNLWAFGSITTLSYSNAVNDQGRSGHATLGLNDQGFFGIARPDLHAALDLLASPRGLLTLTPVVAVALAGVAVMHRRGRRAEARVIAAIFAVYFVYDSGYWLPMGGGSPGPRFLVPTLPFLALGVASAWRRFPGPTLALAVASAVTMIAATITYPLVSTGQTGQWTQRLLDGNFQHTLLSVAGFDNGWPAIAPVLVAFAGAAVLGLRGADRAAIRAGLLPGLLALGAWAVLAAVLAPRLGERVISGDVVGPTGVVDHHGHLLLALAAAAAGAAALGLAARRSGQLVDDEGPATHDAHPEARGGAPAPVLPGGALDPVGVQHHAAYAEQA